MSGLGDERPAPGMGRAGKHQTLTRVTRVTRVSPRWGLGLSHRGSWAAGPAVVAGAGLLEAAAGPVEAALMESAAAPVFYQRRTRP